MIECPNCKQQEFVGTLFCSECGVRLVHVSPVPTGTALKEWTVQETITTKPAFPEGPEVESGALLGLRVISSGIILSLLGRDNYTLGRAGKGQAIIPDIDLGQYDAYDHGVSRIHAEIHMRPDGIYLIDLDSANGTLVNGKKLEAQRPCLVRHGDVLQLGRMRLQLISRIRS